MVLYYEVIMKIAKGVVMTDGINRYNEFFPLKTVINAYNNSDPIGLPLSLIITICS